LFSWPPPNRLADFIAEDNQKNTDEETNQRHQGFICQRAHEQHHPNQCEIRKNYAAVRHGRRPADVGTRSGF
jgi:hypothetical protein